MVVAYLSYQGLQGIHREYCSRSLLNAMLFSNSDACVFLSRTIHLIESGSTQVFRTSNMVVTCALYKAASRLKDISGAYFA